MTRMAPYGMLRVIRSCQEFRVKLKALITLKQWVKELESEFKSVEATVDWEGEKW